MSGRLVSEVHQYCPRDLTPAVRYIFAVLAEDARDTDRIARHSSVERIADITGYNTGTVRNALTELSNRGLIRRLVAKPHRGRGGKHQEYQLAKLQEHHRFATKGDQ